MYPSSEEHVLMFLNTNPHSKESEFLREMADSRTGTGKVQDDSRTSFCA